MAQMPQPNPASASPIRSNEVAPEDRARVEREIAMGNGEKALEVAKAIHKRRPCVESESLLADAYELRFHDQLERGLDASAHELIKHIIRKFPPPQKGWAVGSSPLR